MQLHHTSRSSEGKRSPILGWGQNLRIMSFPRHLLGHMPKSDLEIVGKCVRGNFQPFKGTLVQPSRKILKRNQTNQSQFFSEIDTFMIYQTDITINLKWQYNCNNSQNNVFFLQRSCVSASNWIHEAGLEVKRSPISGIKSIFVTFQSLYFLLGSNISHAPRTLLRAYWLSPPRSWYRLDDDHDSNS